MKRLSLIGILALAVSMGLLTFGLVLRKEPHFQGRTLRQWLVDRPKYENPFIVRPAPLSVEAQQAVKAIGTNAIPILLEMIQARDSAFKTWLNSGLNRQRIIGFRLQPATEQRAMAFAGFEILGEEAKAAAPALASLIKDPDFGVRYTALESLRRVTSDKNLLVPLLLEACRDSAPAIRFNANTYLHFRSPESLRTAGIPDLLDEFFKQATNDVSAMKDRAPKDLILARREARYDLGTIQNGWHLSLIALNTFEPETEIELYRNDVRARERSFLWDLRGRPQTALSIRDKDEMIFKARCTGVRISDDGRRRIDTFKCFTRSEPDQRCWGTLRVEINDKSYSVVVPSSLYKFGHNAADPYDNSRIHEWR